MNSTQLLSREDARLCAGVVREVSSARSISKDPVAVGKLTMAVARLYNSGLRGREELLSAAMQMADLQSSAATTVGSKEQDVQYPGK